MKLYYNIMFIFFFYYSIILHFLRIKKTNFMSYITCSIGHILLQLLFNQYIDVVCLLSNYSLKCSRNHKRNS